MARNDDLFQYLPESVLVHIVSLLPFKEAVQTSVLSKKWQHIWCYTRSIEFNENYFTSNEARRVLSRSGLQALAIGINNSGKKNLIGFAKKWIHSYKYRKVDNMRICFSHPTPDQRSDIDDWIRFAVSKDVEGLDLDFMDPDDTVNYDGFFDLPEYLYQYVVLRSLKLNACEFDPSKCTKWSALRSLSISNVDFRQTSFEMLISNCKVLEHLSLNWCDGMDNLELSSRDLRLTSLVIVDCRPVDGGVITISAPKLRSLKYFGFPQVLYLVDLPCLLEAELDFRLEEVFEEFGDVLAEMLRALFFAKVITVCSYTLQVLPSGTDPLYLPSTLSVNHLILKTELHGNELPGISLFLRSCPCLETLTIEVGYTKHLVGYHYPCQSIMEGRRFWDSQLLAIFCLKEKLKNIKINGFKGTTNEVEFLRFLLTKGRALRRVEIVSSKEAPLQGEDRESFLLFAHKILQFQKASPVVNISFN